MQRDRNLLFGVFAVQLRKVSPSQLMEVAGAWAVEPSRDLSQRLVDAGALTEADRKLLKGLVANAINACGGDASATLAAFGGEEQVHESFRGSIVLTRSGGVSRIEEQETLRASVDEEAVPGVQETPGRYSDLFEHGRGGMGRILLVQDQYLGREIALKELLPGLSPASDAGGQSPVRLSVPVMARFLQEARITGQLEHPSIVPVYELGYRKDGTLYYTMKLVRGRTLSQAIREAGPLRERLALVPHFVDLCQAIAYAHSRRVLHRDIKPDNVMVGEFGETVVLDWGLAKSKSQRDAHAAEMEKTFHALKLGDETEAARTAYGEALGSPSYMPPEQAAGELDKVDERSDVYALGAVLYEILTAKPPYTGKNTPEILKKVQAERPPCISHLEAGVPPELAAICERAMAKDAGQRYASAKELADDVQRFLSGALVQSYEYRFSEHLRRFVVRHKAILATGLAALVAVLGLAAFYNLRLWESRATEQMRRVEAERAWDRERAAREEVEIQRERAERTLYIQNIQLADAAVKERKFARAIQLLGECPERFRGWEWGWLQRLCNLDVLTLGDHPGPVYDVAIAPDASRVATATLLRQAIIWDTASGLRLHTMTAEVDGYNYYFDCLWAVAFSPDGKLLATGNSAVGAPYNNVTLWDAATGQRVRVLRGHPGMVLDLAFSPDGATLATAGGDEKARRDRSARLWDVATGEELKVLEGHGDDVQCLAFSPNGTHLATGSKDGELRLWDVTTGLTVHAVAGHAARIRDLAFHPSGEKLVSAGEDFVTKCWDARTGRELSVRTHHAMPFSVAYSPSGRYFAEGFDDGSFVLWCGREPYRHQGHADRISTIAFSADSDYFVTGSRDGTVKIWSTALRGAQQVLREHHQDILRNVTFSPDGRFLAAGSLHYQVHEARPARIWRVEDGTLLHRLEGHCKDVSSVSFSPRGDWLATGSPDGSVIVWDVTMGRKVQRLFSTLLAPEDAAFTRDGHWLILQGQDGIMKFWNTDTWRLERTLPTGTATDFDVSPSEKYLVTTSYELPSMAQVWDFASLRMIRSIPLGQQGIWDVAFSPDGTSFATASWDTTAKLWDTQTGQELKCFRDHTAHVDFVAFDPEGKRLVTRGGFVKVWDIETAKCLVTINRDPENRGQVAFSPDGRTLACGGVLLQSFPWKEDDYPGDEAEPFAARLGRYKAALWEKRRAGTSEAQDDAGPFWPVMDLPGVDALLDRVRLGETRNGDALALATLRSVFVPHTGFKTLEGIRLCSDLEALTAPQNGIRDVAPLAGLTRLRYLNLSQNEIETGVPLAGLTSSVHLNLAGNRLQDVEFMTGLANLGYLDISENPIADLAPLRTLQQLTHLHSAKVSAVDFSPVAGLKRLRYLNLSGNRIRDLAVFDPMVQLTSLELGANEIADLKPLEHLTHLSALGLDDNRIADAAPLSRLVQLESLSLEGNAIRDIEPVCRLPHLFRLRIGRNPVDNFEPLANLGRVVVLDLSGTGIQDLTPLAGLSNLKYLGLKGNEIASLAPLLNNANLGAGAEVDLTDNPLSEDAITTQMEALRQRGVGVIF